MTKLTLLLALALASAVATAATYYLERTWTKNGNTMCQYSDGTVLNVGYRVCPLKIER